VKYGIKFLKEYRESCLKKMQIFIICCFAATANVAFNQKKIWQIKIGHSTLRQFFVNHLSRKAEGMAR
jgi:hypothetical protein